MRDRKAEREYQRMMARLAELDRVDGTEHLSAGTRPLYRERVNSQIRPGAGPRDWIPAQQENEPRRGFWRIRRSLALLLVAALGLGVAVLYLAPDSRTHLSQVLHLRLGSGRLLPPVHTAATGPHTFLHLNADGSPVTYDPCKVIHYAINPAGMPANGITVVQAAVGSISAATGLAFTYDGTTTRTPDAAGNHLSRNQSVIIGWSDAQHDSTLAGSVVGYGGSAYVQETFGASHYQSGEVVLDTDAFTPLAARGDQAVEQAIVMHELGHVVGLDHVNDPAMLMYPENRNQTGWGAGDLQGLADLGNGTCR